MEPQTPAPTSPENPAPASSQVDAQPDQEARPIAEIPADGCRSSDECSQSDTPVCDPTSGACVECIEDGDCTSTAAPYCDPETNHCDYCVASRCAGVCAEGLGCVECFDDQDCGDDAACDATNRCRAARNECTDDTDCPGAYCAIDGMCGAPIGMACGSADDCYPEACIGIDTARNPVERYCSRTCLRTEDCPDGFSCQELACRRLAGVDG